LVDLIDTSTIGVRQLAANFHVSDHPQCSNSRLAHTILFSTLEQFQ
jgi:hypothetical protein